MVFTQLVPIAFNHVHLFRKFAKIILPEEKQFETLIKFYQGCKIPFSLCFQNFPVFFRLKNITFILLPLPIESYTTTNIHSKPQSQMQQPAAKTSFHYWAVPPPQNLFQSQKIVAISHHNHGTSLNFQKYKFFLGSEENSQCKNIFWANSPCYHPQRSWGKVIFSQVSVILFTGGGVCLSACGDTTPQQGRPPLDKADSPTARQTPLARRPPGKADPLPWQGRPPPCAVHAGRYAQQVGGMHPTGMQFLFSVCKNEQIPFSLCRSNPVYVSKGKHTDKKRLGHKVKPLNHTTYLFS